MKITKKVSYCNEEGFEFQFEPIEDSLTIEKTDTGYTARYLVADTNPQSPEDWGDNNLFLVGYHRSFTVNSSLKISQELAQAIANKGKYEDGSINDEAMQYVKNYHIFELEAYIHSGVSLALSREGNFPDRQWDVSLLGLVFVSKKEWKTRPKAREAALGLISTWNQYMSGDVYGCIKEEYNQNKEQIKEDSCWGFYGYKDTLQELKTF
jgi:hypothetical protein